MLDPSLLVGPFAAGDSLDVPTVGPSAGAGAGTNAESMMRRLAAIIELQSQLDGADDLESAARMSAEMLHHSLDASRVLVGWRNSRTTGCRILADHGGPESDQQRGGDLLAERAADECVVRGRVTCWPPESGVNRHALLAVTEFAESITAAALFAVPLTEPGGERRGALLVIADTPPKADQVDFLHALATPLATKLAGISRSQPTRLQRWVGMLTEFPRHARAKHVGVAVAVIVTLLMLPVHYRINARCELQPVGQRFVAAPFDGPLQQSLVRPGDVVVEGQVLARINPREIDYELAGLKADWSRAQQEQKGMLAQHDIAGSKIAELESERLRLQTELLEYRRFNLEIRSPLAGVIISGDVQQSEGTPLSQGENLFEIAPLGKVIVEIAIPESEYRHASEGMTVQFRLHALPQRTFRGRLDRIHPRAELVEHENVFVGEMLVEDPENMLRPGMLGRATIVADRHPLGWNLFHRAYDQIRMGLGW